MVDRRRHRVVTTAAVTVARLPGSTPHTAVRRPRDMVDRRRLTEEGIMAVPRPRPRILTPGMGVHHPITTREDTLGTDSSSGVEVGTGIRHTPKM